jgi:hypothetical protein
MKKIIIENKEKPKDELLKSVLHITFTGLRPFDEYGAYINKEKAFDLKSVLDEVCGEVFRQQLKHNVDYCHWVDMLKPKSVLNQDELDELIQEILIIDKKLEQITKANMGVNFVVQEGKVEMMDFRPSRKLEDVYLAIKKSIIEQIIGAK